MTSVVVARLPATYALVLSAHLQRTLAVGKLGTLMVRPGYYVYVGSALGPGGLDGRLRHHLAPATTPHWHIDYLRQAAQVTDIWYALSAERLEHGWADVLRAAAHSSIPMIGFGASDCRCPAHLFYFSASPSYEAFQADIAARMRCALLRASPL